MFHLPQNTNNKTGGSSEAKTDMFSNALVFCQKVPERISVLQDAIRYKSKARNFTTILPQISKVFNNASFNSEISFLFNLVRFEIQTSFGTW